MQDGPWRRSLFSMLYSLLGSSFVDAAILFFLATWIWPAGVAVNATNGALFSTCLWGVTTAQGIVLEHVSLRVETVTTVYLLGLTLACQASQGWLLPLALS